MHYKYEHPEFFEGVERPDFQKLNGNLVIYGAGFQGLLAAHLLEKQGVKILCFGDRDVRKQGTLYYGIPVMSPEKMKEMYPNATVMATPYVLNPVIRYLEKELQYKNVITPFSLFLEFDSESFEKLPEIPSWYHPDTLDYNLNKFLAKCVNVQTKYKLFVTDLSVTERCTLKCKNCANFMPCYEPPKDFEYTDTLNDIMSVIKGRVYDQVVIEGGEPFLWEPLPDLIKALSECENVMTIVPISNGTVIPSERMLKAFQDPKVLVRISDYGKYTKSAQLTELFENYGIKFKLQLQKWYEHPSFSKERKTGKEAREVLDSCCKLVTEGNTFAMDGKLFLCPLQANLHRLGIFKSKPDEYVDLRDTDKDRLQNRINEYLERRKPAEICLHCNGRGYTGIEVPPAEQLAPGEKMNIRFE